VIDRLVRSILVLCLAGMIVSLSLLATAAIGTINDSRGSTIPGPYLGLFYLLCLLLGTAGAWAVSRLEALR
jgi:hypothetical protein